MCFNNFLSTSRDRQISLRFARRALHHTGNPKDVGILFTMTIDPQVCQKSSIPFVDVKQEGYYKEKEAEILFATHSIFRIDRMEKMKDQGTDRLWEVHLTLTGDDDSEMNKLTKHLREEYPTLTGWTRLGQILIEIGEPAKAEQSISDSARKNLF